MNLFQLGTEKRKKDEFYKWNNINYAFHLVIFVLLAFIVIVYQSYDTPYNTMHIYQILQSRLQKELHIEGVVDKERYVVQGTGKCPYLGQ